jgi:hypothetical protein
MYYISVPLSVRTPQARIWYVLYICAIKKIPCFYIAKQTKTTKILTFTVIFSKQISLLVRVRTKSKQISTIQVDVLFKLGLLKSRFV